MNTALIIIDQQKGNSALTKAHYDAKHASQSVEACLQLAQSGWFDEVFSTGFINPKDSIWQNQLRWCGLSQEEDYALIEEIEDVSTQIFFSSSYFPINEELLQYMDWKNIRHVVIGGMETDCCVLFGACQLFEKGIDVSVASFACASATGAHQAGLESLRHRIGADNVLETMNEVRSWIKKKQVVPSF